MESERERFGLRPDLPYLVFNSQNAAENFVAQIKTEFGFESKVIKKSSASVGDEGAGFWDISPPYGKVFAVHLLYRLSEKNINWQTFKKQSLTLRQMELQEYLRALAIQKGQWRENILTHHELQWYQEFADLNQNQVNHTLKKAKEAFIQGRKKEMQLSFGLGGGLLSLAILSLMISGGEWGTLSILGLILGPVLIGFGLTRKK